MALVTLPNTRVRNIERVLERAVARVMSPFTGSEQVQDWGGRWWRYSFDIGPFAQADARGLDAILQSLGPETPFLFADPSAVTSANLGSPRVKGGSQTGTTLATDGWTNGVTIPAGTYFSLGADTATRLHVVTAAATADGSGNADLAIAPALRESPADNAVLEYQDPVVQLRLAGPIPAAIRPGTLYTFTLEARENL